MTGTTIAQAIPVAITPILSRIYTVEDFGVLALFVSITSIFGVLVSGRYELAIMLPKEDEDAINILALGILLVSGISLTLLLIVLFFHDWFVRILANDNISFWLYFVPLTVLFMGMYNLLMYFNNRKKYYKDIAKATVIKSIVMSVIQLSLFFLKNGTVGLISGQISTHLAANLRLVKNIVKNKNLLSAINKKSIITMAKRYKKFPLISIWSSLSSTLSFRLNPIIISHLYKARALGFFAMAEKILIVPTIFIGKSIGQVFFEEASKSKHEPGDFKKVCYKTLMRMLLIGAPSFLFLFFTVEFIFTFVLGEEWTIAGQYAKILVPFYFINFILTPFTLIPIIMEKNEIDLIFQVGMLFCLFIVFIAAFLNDLSIEGYLYTYSILLSLYNLFYIIFLMKYVKKSSVR